MVASPVAVEKSLCELTFGECPEDHDGELLQVPLNVISLHAEVKHCNPQIETTVRIETPPAIMFVIDHSGSMEMTSAGNDVEEARFSVVSQLLDEIYEMNNESEVGIVCFANRLSFDWRDNEVFERMNGVRPQDNDSYLPLRPLSHATFGLNTVKEILRTDKSAPIGGEPEFHKRLIYGTERVMTRTPANSGWPKTSIRYGTDITLGLTAALEAFQNTDAPRDRRFIVFLSDGEATSVDEEREGLKNLYTHPNFLSNFPTTFTIWFGDNPHPSLVAMTDAIKTNGYSQSNPSSDLWSINTPHDELLQLLTSIVQEQIFPATSSPSTAIVKDVQAASMTDSSFRFTKPLPLGVTSDTLDMTFKYLVIDTVSGSQPDTTDTTITSSIFVERSATASMAEWADTVCYTRTLELHNNGVSIDQVTDGMNDLEVFLMTESHRALFDSSYISDGSVTISSVVGGDSYTAGMRNEGDYYLRPFDHEVSQTSSSGDAIVQHRQIDSLRIVWRNTYHPLDTIVLVVPVLHRSVDRPYTNRPDTKAYTAAELDSIVDTVFSGSITGVTLNTDTAGATIWYTLDGIAPQKGNAAHRYNPGQTFDITGEETLLTAFATKDDYADSKVLRVRYIRSYVRVPVQQAFYEDLDGDGIVDAFTLVVDPAEADRMNIGRIANHPELITLGDVNSGAFDITKIEQGGAANEIRINVTPKSPSYMSGRTISVTIGEDESLKEDGYLKSGNLQATDRVAPVVIEAVYIMQSKNWDGTADTLRVRMSETFAFTASAISSEKRVKAFNLLWTDENSQYQLDLEPVGYDAFGIWYTFIVRNRGSGPSFPADNDSLWIADGIIQDMATPPNVQDGTNKRVRLKVQYPPVNMTAGLVPNPIGPKPVDFRSTLGVDVEPGTIALVQVKPEYFSDSAYTAERLKSIDVEIYDPVGNVVANELGVINVDGSFYAQWDGRNRTGRMVGAGTYLAVVYIRYRDETTRVQTIRLGIRR